VSKEEADVESEKNQGIERQETLAVVPQQLLLNALASATFVR